jgi:hypothetical protein
MRIPGVVSVVTDGTEYWTEIYQSDSPQGTFARHVDSGRWPSMFEAKKNSPWWPEGEPGRAATPDNERMHRATCSWASCSHRVVWVVDVKGGGS